MNLASLKASLALWQRREVKRKKLHTSAQQDLMEARAAGASGGALKALTDRRDLRSKQLTEARSIIDRRLKQIDALTGKKVHRPAEKVKLSVACQSSRNGVKPRIIVIHSTEGSNLKNSFTDLSNLGHFFDNINTQASSHVATDSDGYCAQFVPDAAKSWACASYNSVSLNIEQIGFAAQGSWPEAQLRATAKYVAYWSKKYDIPITNSTTHGVCQHSQLGVAGGGHHDAGVNYPFDKMLGYARAYLKNGW